MSDKYLVIINCGSSSLKFSVFNLGLESVASGIAERLGSNEATMRIEIHSAKSELALHAGDHNAAIYALIQALALSGIDKDSIVGIGHRVVHGGEYFSCSTSIDDAVMEKIRKCEPLAPLHNPANLLGIRISKESFPNIAQVAVFDTAFHQTLPEHAYIYGLPYEYYQDLGLRRYGFHGISHQFVAHEAIARLNLDPTDNAILTCHLGNGCSATAIKNGKSIDTSMGLTPLEGLLMGTRAGDIDPSVHLYLANSLGYELSEITSILNSKSGLLGISGLSNDMRTLCEEETKGNARAKLAIDIFCYRLAKTVGALAMPLGRIDALVFTGGIGENAAVIRARTIDLLSLLGFTLSSHYNQNHGRNNKGVITQDDSKKALVIPTQEEWMIAKDTMALVNG